MYERLLDKAKEPSQEEITSYLGTDAYQRLVLFEETLSKEYELNKELRFPFGNKYGWGYKYSHKQTHLCYAFFEQDAFTIMIQLPGKQAAKVEAVLPTLSTKANTLWKERYPCGDHGGWMHDRILSDVDLSDVLSFIHVKKAPKK